MQLKLVDIMLYIFGALFFHIECTLGSSSKSAVGEAVPVIKILIKFEKLIR